MAGAICRRLRMSNARTGRISELVAQHMRIRNVPDMRESTRRRFLRQDCFLQLLELHRADCMGCHGKLDLYEYATFLIQEMHRLRALIWMQSVRSILNNEHS